MLTSCKKRVYDCVNYVCDTTSSNLRRMVDGEPPLDLKLGEVFYNNYNQLRIVTAVDGNIATHRPASRPEMIEWLMTQRRLYNQAQEVHASGVDGAAVEWSGYIYPIGRTPSDVLDADAFMDATDALFDHPHKKRRGWTK